MESFNPLPGWYFQTRGPEHQREGENQKCEQIKVQEFQEKGN